VLLLPLRQRCCCVLIAGAPVVASVAANYATATDGDRAADAFAFVTSHGEGCTKRCY